MIPFFGRCGISLTYIIGGASAMKKDLKDKFKKIVEESTSMGEALYKLNAEYIFAQYEYMAFKKMIKMKWELLAEQK
jgi:hypothetical protein